VLADGGSQRAAGRAADRHHGTVQYWLKTDPSFSAGIGRAKDAILKQAAQLATLSHAEMLSRLEDEGQRRGLEFRDLNRTWGTAADKLVQAARDEMANAVDAEDHSNLSRDELLDRLASELDPEMVEAIRVRQRH
tara:strand:- start:5178 stop:5582 length:405 start_codon:yes stop_codon:yes gene_type:complete